MNELERLQPNTDDITETAKRMSEVKRYELSSLPLDDGEVIQVVQEWADGNYVFFTDYESERLAHEETKRNHASVVERLFYSEREQLRLDKELEENKKRLEELEDLFYFQEIIDTGNHDSDNLEEGFESEFYDNLDNQISQKLETIRDQAIANSKARSKS